MNLEDYFLEKYGPSSPSTASTTSAGNLSSGLPEEVRQAAKRGWHVFPVSPLAKFTAQPDLLIGEATSEISRLEEFAAEYPLCGWRVAVTKQARRVLDEPDPIGKQKGNNEMTKSISTVQPRRMGPSVDSRTTIGRGNRRKEPSKAEDFACSHSENQKLRMKLAIEGGIWCLKPPLGYDLSLRRSKGEPNIVACEKEAAHVRKSFELMRDGNLLPVEALRIMTELGLRSKGGKVLAADTFVEMLRNPVYIGKIASKYGLSKGLHVGLVPEEVFEDVQATLDGTRKPPTPFQRKREGFPLRRFLLCACGTPLTRYSAKGGTGKVYRYYFCRKCHALRPVRGTEEGGE